MTFDVDFHLGAVERIVSSLDQNGHPARAVIVVRRYDTTLEALWDALTNPTRIPCWLLPITGKLELGGRYQLEGNAGGLITACKQPTHLALTWEFGSDVSWVEAHLSSDEAGHARFMLTHTAHDSEHWRKYGPGAVGVGWELALMGLAIHLARPSDPKLDEAAFSTSIEGKAFITGSSEAWGQASIAFGTDTKAALSSARRTTAFYTGEA